MKLRNYLTIGSALLALNTGCTNDDLTGHPEGSIPLELGDITIAGVQTAGKSRAAIAEDANGYTGIRKSGFVSTNTLDLVLSDDGGNTTTTLTATLTDGSWVLSQDKVYIIPGTTTITATHTPGTTAPGLVYADKLSAATYTLSGQKVTFAMKHANALIDITCPAGVSPTKIKMTANNATADENLNTVIEEETDGSMHYRTIAAPGTLKDITAEISGTVYTATLATPLTMEANKRYPVVLAFKEGEMTASIASGDLNWGEGGQGTLGVYTRSIGTPEDLAQFAKDVNNGEEGAYNGIVLQTADIDMSKLKTATDANAANPGKNYDYEITANQWDPIENFQGKYNGNGFTISNLKTISTQGDDLGFFNRIRNAVLTGIHLRDCRFTNSGTMTGGTAALALEVNGSIISLCSATGEITVDATVNVGAFIGKTTGNRSYITRCSADVDLIRTNGSYSASTTAGFIGTADNCAIVGCRAAGDVTASNDGCKEAGFAACVGNNTTILGCSYVGEMINGTALNAFIHSYNNSTAAGVNVVGCYSTSSNTNSFGPVHASITYANCAYTGTLPGSLAGVTGGVAVGDLYATVTAGNEISASGIKSLHWSTADGYTLNEVNREVAWAVAKVWKNNGTAAPTVDMGYEGSMLYEGKPANLLAIPGQTAYWVAPVNVDKIAWTDIDFNTICPDGWKVPSKDEFAAMTGLPADDAFHSTENQTAIAAAFPDDQYYWTHTGYESNDTFAWYLYVRNNDTVGIRYGNKSDLRQVRCVRRG